MLRDLLFFGISCIFSAFSRKAPARRQAFDLPPRATADHVIIGTSI